MAVNVSRIVSVCLYCKTDSDKDAEKEFHEIYDEVGQELQLPTLVEQLFRIKLKDGENKQLCEDCVNHLIELYDLEEHAKEKGVSRTSKHSDLVKQDLEEKTADLPNIISSDTESISEEHSGTCLKKQSDPLTQEHAVLPNNINPNNSQLMLKNTDIIDYSSLKIFPLGDIQVDNNIVESFPEEEFVIICENAESELNVTTSNNIIEVTNVGENEFDEQIEFVEDDGDQDMEIENMIYTNTLNENEELEITRQSPMESIGNKGDLLSEIDIETTDSSNNFMKDIVYEEELDRTLIDNDKNNTPSVDNQEVNMLDDCIDDSYYEEHQPIGDEEDRSDDMMLDVENDKISSNSSEESKNIKKTVTASFNLIEPDALFDSVEDIDSGKVIGDQDEVSHDDLSLEEEYLIEEINCPQEYDKVDLNEYLDKVLATKFQDLQLKWETKCKLCLDKYDTFEDLLKHSCITEFEEEQEFCCILKDCEENIKNLSTLARHLIIKHYDKLESIAIYGKCPDCQKTFSTITDFNKHSCCRSIKRKPGSPNYCQYCDMDFQSLKRYVFHMQYHFTNRRPKVCLLCGALFKNSNDFFEHTQYQHMPETSMACRKCDRFFKEKEVYNSHMDLHEDSKYQYSCTFCPKKYTNKSGLNLHIDIYHNNKSNALWCSHCEKEFVNKSSYRNHLKCHANIVQVDSFICATCGVITNNSEFIKSHIKSDKDSPCFSSSVDGKTLGLGFTCENCSLDFHTIKHLQAHRLSKSHSDDLFCCGICRQSFKSLRHMRNHSSNHKDFKEWQESFPISRFFVCNIGDCTEFYPIWASLYYHKKRPHKSKESTTSPDKFKCQFCQQQCSSKMSLAVHVARSHNNSNVKCSHCKRGFNSQKKLQEHIDYFHTPVKCDICIRKLKNRRNLESHKNMVHLNIKRYFCKHCEKGYFHRSERDTHEIKVHPEVSYKCEVCNFTTNYPESLEIHMDMHNNQLKFKCTICGKSFGRKQLLTSHSKRHLNKKDFSCAKYLNESGCDGTFLTYNLLKRHIQSKHPNSSYNINMQRDEERKKALNKCPETDQIENISYEILRSDDGSISDTEFQRDAIEMVLENDEEFDGI